MLIKIRMKFKEVFKFVWLLIITVDFLGIILSYFEILNVNYSEKLMKSKYGN
jgi:hypothetical protein